VRERDPAQKGYGKDHRAGGGPGEPEKNFHLGGPFKGIEKIFSGFEFFLTCNLKLDDLVKSRNSIKFFIPAKAGIQSFQ
jgi:hypothetical protein